MSSNSSHPQVKPLKSILKKTPKIENVWDPRDYKEVLDGVKIKREYVEVEPVNYESPFYKLIPGRCSEFDAVRHKEESYMGMYRFSTEHGTDEASDKYRHKRHLCSACRSEFEFLSKKTLKNTWRLPVHLHVNQWMFKPDDATWWSRFNERAKSDCGKYWF